MEMQGHSAGTIKAIQMLGPLLDPRLMLGILSYLPLLNKMRDNIVELGLPEEKLYAAMKKFEKIGGRTEDGRRNPWYQIIFRHGRIMVNRNNRFYHAPVDTLVTLTGKIPSTMLPKVPSWVRELTYQPTA